MLKLLHENNFKFDKYWPIHCCYYKLFNCLVYLHETVKIEIVLNDIYLEKFDSKKEQDAQMLKYIQENGISKEKSKKKKRKIEYFLLKKE